MGYAIINGWRERVLIDSGVQSNAVVPAYVKQHKMKVRPVHDLAMHSTLIPISSIGGHMVALRYIIINVQVEGIPSYYEEQVALVIPNMTQLGMKVPVILGTPTIHRLCRQMKESEIENSTGGVATCPIELRGIEECFHTPHDSTARPRFQMSNIPPIRGKTLLIWMSQSCSKIG